MCETMQIADKSVINCSFFSIIAHNVRASNARSAREITCHVGSHSVTCYPTEMILTLLAQHAGTHLSILEG